MFKLIYYNLFPLCFLTNEVQVLNLSFIKQNSFEKTPINR